MDILDIRVWSGSRGRNIGETHWIKSARRRPVELHLFGLGSAESASCSCLGHPADMLVCGSWGSGTMKYP